MAINVVSYLGLKYCRLLKDANVSIAVLRLLAKEAETKIKRLATIVLENVDN
jgi:hypothetical protein